MISVFSGVFLKPDDPNPNVKTGSGSMVVVLMMVGMMMIGTPVTLVVSAVSVVRAESLRPLLLLLGQNLGLSLEMTLVSVVIVGSVGRVEKQSSDPPPGPG